MPDTVTRNTAVSTVSRRQFLRYVYLGGSAAAASTWLAACGSSGSASTASGGGSITPPVGGPELTIPTGPLAAIGTPEPTGIDNMVLPPGFTVRRVARVGFNPLTDEPAPDGFEWHSAPDGGAVYLSPADGGWVYVSNSEAGGGNGGVGALRFDADGNLIDAYPILTGTTRNCAGGTTPWGTWLSCEENGANGQVYECDPFGTPEDAVVKPALGSRNHEAAIIDPINHVAYTTEDAGAGRFWRFVSAESDLVDDGGVTRQRLEEGELQVMNIEGFEDGGSPAVGDVREAVRVSWATPGTVPGSGIGGTDLGAASAGTAFDGGEGLWYYEIPEAARTIPELGMTATRGVVFFATKGDNRVWAYDIENELVEIIFDNEQIDPDFNDVDNLVISPGGDVIVAEDGSGMRLMVVIPNVGAKVLMQITGDPGSEITGPAFHPDGSKLYFSSQRAPTAEQPDGVTYEVTIPPEFRV